MFSEKETDKKEERRRGGGYEKNERLEKREC